MWELELKEIDLSLLQNICIGLSNFWIIELCDREKDNRNGSYMIVIVSLRFKGKENLKENQIKMLPLYFEFTT